jgi:hypothetical protein
MRSLLLLYRHTGNEKYLTPIPKAIDYLRRSALPDGRLARFYELRTNRPLYFTRADYALTYSDADMPTHYSFKSTSRLDAIEADFKQLRQDGPDKRNGPRTLDTPKLTESLTRRAKSVVETMDEKGRWIEDGRLRYHDKNDPTRHVLSTRTFIQNLDTLTEFLSATRP